MNHFRSIATILWNRLALRRAGGYPWAAMPDDELQRQLPEIGVVARVAPEDKIRLVRLLQQAGNVVAMRPGLEDLAPVLVCAHLDTVFARDVQLTFRRDGNRVTGPGIGDNCRGLAVLVAIARSMNQAALRTPGTVTFVANVVE